MAALIGVASQVVGEVNGLYSASFGADRLDFLSAALGASGSYGGESVSFVQQDTAEAGISKVDVTTMDGSNEVLFSFYYATITNAVSDGGDGSVEFQAFSSLADAGGSPFFALTVNPDSTYTFDMLSNEMIATTTVSGEDFEAFGLIGEVTIDDLSLTIRGSDDINASDNGIGVSNPQISSGEWMLLDFLNKQTYVSFTLQQWTGSATAAVLMLTLGGMAFDFNTAVAGDQNLSVPKGGERITVIVDVDLAGTWNYDAATKTYTLYTDTEFDDLRLNYVSGTPNFNINHITYDQTVTVEDLALNFNLAVTDADGDTVALDDELTITMLDPDEVVSAAADGVDADIGVVLSSRGEADPLIGGEGDDILIGGDSGDLLSGGAGAGVFKWVAGNTGTDTVTDFVIHHNAGGDQLDLSELLVGASGSAENIGNLLSYIDISVSGSDTLVRVSSTAVADPTVAPEQTIVLDNVDLYASYGVGNENDLVLSMLGDGTLKIDTV